MSLPSYKPLGGLMQLDNQYSVHDLQFTANGYLLVAIGQLKYSAQNQTNLTILRLDPCSEN